MSTSTLRNTEFYLRVAKGEVPGHSIMSKFEILLIEDGF